MSSRIAAFLTFLAASVILAIVLYVNRSPEESRPESEDKNAMEKAKENDIWKQKLTPLQYKVTREHGTERAFTGQYWDHKEDGIYKCVCCGQPLFDSQTKFKSGTGWPSFYDIITPDQIKEASDDSLIFERRTEVICSGCDAHLGHVFPDGPAPTGLRYCVNSAALDFEKRTDK